MIGPSMRCHPNPIFIAGADLKTTSLERTRRSYNSVDAVPTHFEPKLAARKELLGSGTNLSRSQDSPNQTRVYNSLPKQFALCLQKTEKNCMFLIIFKTGVNLCLVNCYCVCTVVNNLTLMKSAPLQYSSKRCNFDHRGVSAFQLST